MYVAMVASIHPRVANMVKCPLSLRCSLNIFIHNKNVGPLLYNDDIV